MTRRMPGDKRKRVILNAATKLFAEKGTAGMTTAELAKRSGVTEPILYRHFPSKKRLIEALIAETLEKIGGALERAAREVPPERALEHICRRYPEIIHEHDAVARVVPRALAEHPSGPVNAALRKYYESYEDLLGGLIKAGQRAGTVRPGLKPHAAAWHFIQAAIGYQLSLGLKARGQREDGFDSLISELLLTGVQPSASRRN